MRLQPTPRLIERARSASEIAKALERLFDQRGFGPGDDDPLREALVRVAARYGQIVTACVNAAPDLHLEAFASLLGGVPRAPQAARVHLSFTPAAGRQTATPLIVPMHTRVAAPPAEGDSVPVIFETLADIELVRADAVRALYVDAGHGQVADVGGVLTIEGLRGDPLTAALPIVHALHIAQRVVFGVPGLQQVRVELGVADEGAAAAAASAPLSIEWVVPAAQGDLPLVVVSDTTAGLTRSGEVVLTAPAAWPATSVDGIESLWLTLRVARVTPTSAAGDAGVSASSSARVPRLTGLTLRAVAATAAQALVAACHDGVPLDISKDHFPFGERPRFGTVFQLQGPAFAEPGNKVELHVVLTNPEGSTTTPIPPVSREGRPRVAWEISTPRGFEPLTLSDGTRALTHSGTVAFTVPDNVAATTIAGRREVWLRARLASGHYGSPVLVEGNPVPLARAPAIRSLTVTSTLERGPLAPEGLVAQGALASRRVNATPGVPFDAFVAPDVAGPALYVGLAAQPGALAAGRVVCWHVRPALPLPPLALVEAPSTPAVVRWQVHAATGWRDVDVRDASAGLTQSGIVRLTLPDDAAPWLGSAPDPTGALAWLRIVWPTDATSGAVPVGLAINSVAARQSQRLRDEVVGSSNGRAAQTFKALRTPIVGEVLLQVREGDDAWVNWQEVDDLSESRPDARAFTLDRASGELRFGNGRFGRIPPLGGANNVRLHAYASGGGRRGNQAPGAIAQLLSAIPAVESVVNLEASAGGFDGDDAARVQRHAAAWLRHRDRAICADDFADLALRASPEVARAYCVAGRDLGAAPTMAAELQAGVVSVIVVPRGDDAEPQPDLALLASVKSYLDARRSGAGRLVLAGPTYARVAVKLQVVAEDGWSPHAVAVECALQIERFLHPLHGGVDGRGWALNERPHRSDINGLLGTIDGVVLVRGLILTMAAPSAMPFIASAGPIDVAPEGPAS